MKGKKKADENPEKRKPQGGHDTGGDGEKSAPRKQSAPGPDENAAPIPADTAPAAREISEEEAAVDDNLHFHIVGIGASAGGLRALQGFFDHMPADSGLAFVVVQHLDPKHESIMSSLLSRHTDMPVVEIRDEIPVEPNKVYVKPPGHDVIIVDHVLRLAEPPQGQIPALPIDTFFRSLAETHGEQAICIVLSGAGRDGTIGLKMVKGAGGLSIVQDEEQAEYGGMPGSAIGTGLADFILPVERMPEEIQQFVHHPSIRKDKAEKHESRYEADFQKVLMSVRTHLGTDFSHYKRNTIRRRIERRLALHQIDSLSEYLQFIRHKPEEIHALFHDLTINVTSFFRDPEAWEILRKIVAENIITGKRDGDDLRVWVVGCSTGEEAYSLAIALQEVMEEQGKQLRVKIFATDVNEDAVETARAATYPDTIAADVSPVRLSRFFVKRDASYRVRDQLREMVVFAAHDVTRDPPFSQLDLVTCRNLLIYMDNVLQRSIIPLLHYGLRPGGILFLGTSESTGDFSDLFFPVDNRWKLFRALKADTEKYLNHAHLMQVGAESSRVRERLLQSGETELEHEVEQAVTVKRKGDNIRALVERMITERYTPPAVLVNRDLRVLYFHGDTEKFLTPPRGEPEYRLLKITRRELQYRLRRAMQEAEGTGKPVRVEGTQVDYGKLFLIVDMNVIPFEERETGYMLVTFEEHAQPEETEKAREENTDSAVRALRHELYATKQDLQATIEELETSNEELKSANEELQANNEELQSTNEELETSREELQSTNEELETVNSELQKKNEQLGRANDDLINLFAVTNIGTIFLDAQLCIMRFTPAVKRIFSLIDSDVGRPITDLANRLNYPELSEDARQVLDSLERREREVSTVEGQWFLVDIRPYRTSENVIEGVVITFTNITERKKAEQQAQEAQAYAEDAMQTSRQPMLLIDAERRVLSANRAFYRAFQLLPQETEGRTVFEIEGGKWGFPELAPLLDSLAAEGAEIEDVRVEHDFPRVGRRELLLNLRRTGRGGRSGLMLLFLDVLNK